MKLRPTQTRGGRVEVGRKNSRERPLFAEPDKAGNNGKVKPVYLEVFATMGFAVRNQGYWIASWVPNPQIKPSWKRELGLITLNLIIACILGYSIHHLGISMNTSRFIIQRKMNEKEAICFNLAFILEYFLTFLATFMFISVRLIDLFYDVSYRNWWHTIKDHRLGINWTLLFVVIGWSPQFKTTFLLYLGMPPSVIWLIAFKGL